MGAPEAATIAGIVRLKLEAARKQLIERNLRNKLVNCPLTSKRSTQVRVVGGLANEVFRTLLINKREMTFMPGRGLPAEEGSAEGQDSDFATWTPPGPASGSAEDAAPRHRDTVLQTQLTAEGLQKRLTSLYYESIETEEEQGVNVLYLAVGFLRWFEDARSEVERFAPLVLIPVELVRKGARDRFQLKARDEDLYTNVSLKVWLAEQHSIELPDLSDSDEWLPGDYFEQVRTAIARAPRWAVLDSEILLGFFSFNKFLLWRDLDPSNWPDINQLLGHRILRSMLAPQEETGQSEAPVIPDDARVDAHFKASDQVAILDTDSSQTVAIQTALQGRDLVIQGPPGTGKSQTIANIIAAAIHKGKSVLFVAEKLAALQVVYERLRGANLSPLCFELHSRRASKQQVLGQLREALNAAAPPLVPGELCQQLDQVTATLWDHSDRLHTSHLPSGYTPFQVVGKMCRLRDRGTPVPDFRVKGAEEWTAKQIREFLGEMELGRQRLELAGAPARHPWRGCARDSVNPLDLQRLKDSASKLSGGLEAVAVILRSVWPLVRPRDQDDLHSLSFGDLPRVAKALALAAAKPSEPLDLLCHPRWSTTDLDRLQALADLARQLAALQKEIESVFTEAAWNQEWTAVRAEIAGSGRSLFRFLRGPYREALRTYRGASRALIPKRYDERLASLDLLILGQQLRDRLRSEGQAFGADLGPIWPTLPGGWPRLSTLAGWLRAASAFEPSLSVRNRRLLSWSDAPDKWSARLDSVTSSVASQMTDFANFCHLQAPVLTGQIGTLTVSLGELFERARGWNAGIDSFNEWPPVRELLRRLHEMTDGSLDQRVFNGQVGPGGFVERVELAICEQVWNRMCQRDSELARIDGRLLDRYVTNFRALDQSRISAAAAEVARKHFDGKPTGSVGQMGIVRAELNKSRKFLPVRRLLDLAGEAVQVLKPVFLMSPLSVAQYLAPGRLKFDLLLIDEASQVRPEDSLGAIARAGQIVVVGDAKQLPPTNFFNRLVQNNDDENDDGDGSLDGAPVIGSMESILSLCDATLSNRTMLRWHYRSHHPALIAVSNFSFYGNKLLLPPSVSLGQAADGFGVVFHRTPTGGYDRGRSHTNMAEAEQVADAVCTFARSTPEKSLGVGTFSVAQRDVIRDRIEARRRESPELEEFFSPSRPNPFFVKNLESIQGDERDVIFISVGYGRDSEGRLSQNFGPINNDGGERRLNVLISRAKERCEVYSSLSADDIDISSRRAGVTAFRQFLQYAEKGYLDVPETGKKTFDSDFEESVACFLVLRGYQVHPQVGMAGFYIDLGVLVSKGGSKYLLGIECDGATYHSSRAARDRDRIRQQILESRGWKIHRIWSSDWFNRRTHEEHRLLDALEQAQNPSVRSTPTQPVTPAPPKSPHEGAPVAPKSRSATNRYVEAAFRVRSSSAPHEAPREVVQDAVRRILEIEGPIHEEEVARRLATVWGLDRAGSRIQDVSREALESLRRANQGSSEARFWSLASTSISKVRDRSETESITLRRAEYLPKPEIAFAARDVVRESVRVPVDDLIVEVARRLGFQRTGADLQEVIRHAIHGEIGTTLTAHHDGSVTLAVAAQQANVPP